jgi:hypothetical protein
MDGIVIDVCCYSLGGLPDLSLFQQENSISEPETRY